MTVNVYWACIEKNWMVADAPSPVYPSFLKNQNFYDERNNVSLSSCPAFRDSYFNVYGLKSLFDYSFKIQNGIIKSDLYDQEFFDDHVVIRSIDMKFFSFNNRYIFFSDEDSLLTTFYEYPIFEDNNITQKCIPIQGTYDIGKWFRNTEFPFYLKKDVNDFYIERNEVYSYIRFHSKKKIQFIQFKWNSILDNFCSDSTYISRYNKVGLLNNYYKLFKNKKFIIKEIKRNII